MAVAADRWTWRARSGGEQAGRSMGSRRKLSIRRCRLEQGRGVCKHMVARTRGRHHDPRERVRRADADEDGADGSGRASRWRRIKGTRRRSGTGKERARPIGGGYIYVSAAVREKVGESIRHGGVDRADWREPTGTRPRRAEGDVAGAGVGCQERNTARLAVGLGDNASKMDFQRMWWAAGSGRKETEGYLMLDR